MTLLPYNGPRSICVSPPVLSEFRFRAEDVHFPSPSLLFFYEILLPFFFHTLEDKKIKIEKIKFMGSAFLIQKSSRLHERQEMFAKLSPKFS